MKAEPTDRDTDATNAVENSELCWKCHRPLDAWVDRCSRCQADVGFPNVRAAMRDAEVAALEVNYLDAVAEALALDAREALDMYQNEVENASYAVVNRTPEALVQLLQSEDDISRNFYRMVEAGLRKPDSDYLNALRPMVDQAFFPSYSEKITFAALSLEPQGLSSYGRCSLIMKTSDIESRSTTADRNSLMWAIDENWSLSDLKSIPPGHRATWAARGKLAVAKLVGQVRANISSGLSHQEILVRGGQDSRSDEFVEVHIWGSYTIDTVQEVQVLWSATPNRQERFLIKIAKERLKAIGIGFMEVSS